VRDLAALLDQLDAAAARGDVHGVWDLDLAFHQRLYELSGSRLFLETWNLFRDQVRLWHRISSGLPRISTGLPGAEAVAGDRRLHQPLFEALRARDAVAAEAAAREHVEAGIRMLGLDAPIGSPAA